MHVWVLGMYTNAFVCILAHNSLLDTKPHVLCYMRIKISKYPSIGQMNNVNYLNKHWHIDYYSLQLSFGQEQTPPASHIARHDHYPFMVMVI